MAFEFSASREIRRRQRNRERGARRTRGSPLLPRLRSGRPGSNRKSMTGVRFGPATKQKPFSLRDFNRTQGQQLAAASPTIPVPPVPFSNATSLTPNPANAGKTVFTNADVSSNPNIPATVDQAYGQENDAATVSTPVDEARANSARSVGEESLRLRDDPNFGGEAGFQQREDAAKRVAEGEGTIWDRLRRSGRAGI